MQPRHRHVAERLGQRRLQLHMGQRWPWPQPMRCRRRWRCCCGCGGCGCGSSCRGRQSGAAGVLTPRRQLVLCTRQPTAAPSSIKRRPVQSRSLSTAHSNTTACNSHTACRRVCRWRQRRLLQQRLESRPPPLPLPLLLLLLLLLQHPQGHLQHLLPAAHSGRPRGWRPTGRQCRRQCCRCRCRP